MLNNDICEFYKKIIDDEKLKNTLGYELEKVSTDNELKILLNKKILPLAKKWGYSFTYEDLIGYEKEAIKSLDRELLKSVAGGTSNKLAKIASIVSLSAMGLNLFSPIAAFAANDSLIRSSKTNVVETKNLTADLEVKGKIKKIINLINELKQLNKQNDKEITSKSGKENSIVKKESVGATFGRENAVKNMLEARMLAL